MTNYTSLIYIIIVVALEGTMHQIDKLHKTDLHIYCGNFVSDTATNYTSLICIIIVAALEGTMHQIDKLHKPDLSNHYANFGRENASDR